MSNKDKCLTPWLKVENRLERSGLLDRKTYARITLYTETLYLPYVFLDPCRIKKGIYSDKFGGYVYSSDIKEIKTHMDDVLIVSGYILLTEEQFDKYQLLC